ncbi:hypothetical protein J6590_073036 [Homalodisca vitripennis]|nr:hypothetical protein J6590_073036 [Homalodisca vitripennis]
MYHSDMFSEVSVISTLGAVGETELVMNEKCSGSQVQLVITADDSAVWPRPLISLSVLHPTLGSVNHYILLH